MKRDFERVVRGMSMDQVEAILGPPNESHPSRFGTEPMTTWTYHADSELLFVWFDEQGKVKLKSVN